jgi:hypothetical protein
MSRFVKLSSQLLQFGDERFIEAAFSAVSVDPDKLRARLRTQGLVYQHETASNPPTMDQLNQTAERVIKLSSDNATAMGGIAGAIGALSLPPEIAAHIIAVVRLAQRLAVVYGFDTKTDQGRMVLWQVLAEGFEVDFPAGGSTAIRLSEVLSVRDNTKSVTSSLAQAMVRRSSRLVGRRFQRLIPILSSAPAAMAARRRVLEAGQRMHVTYRQLADLPLGLSRGIEDAIEIDS